MLLLRERERERERDTKSVFISMEGEIGFCTDIVVRCSRERRVEIW